MDKLTKQQKGYTRYEVEVDGQKIYADYNPNKYGALHVEWQGEKGNPISETGYRSDFIMGTEEENGLTKENIQQKLQERAEFLAKEQKPKKVKKSVLSKKEVADLKKLKKEIDARYYEKNKEKIKLRVKKYAEVNKSKIADRKANWYKNRKNI